MYSDRSIEEDKKLKAETNYECTKVIIQESENSDTETDLSWVFFVCNSMVWVCTLWRTNNDFFN